LHFAPLQTVEISVRLDDCGEDDDAPNRSVHPEAVSVDVSPVSRSPDSFIRKPA
jgi:hypothetical protein